MDNLNKFLKMAEKYSRDIDEKYYFDRNDNSLIVLNSTNRPELCMSGGKTQILNYTH